MVAQGRRGAEAAATTTDTPVLAAVVVELETAAGARLGSSRCDDPVLLRRRFDRAHRLLVADGPRATDLDLVEDLLVRLGRRPVRPAPAGPVGRRPVVVAR